MGCLVLSIFGGRRFVVELVTLTQIVNMRACGRVPQALTGYAAYARQHGIGKAKVKLPSWDTARRNNRPILWI